MSPEPLRLPSQLDLELAPQTPLESQVGGHAGVMSDSSGSLVIKPARAREVAFYQLIASSGSQNPLSRLKPFVPVFYGTLRYEGHNLSPDFTDGNREGKEQVPESVVMENLSFDYTHPTILDVKLGKVLYDERAPPAKRARMEKTAESTTSGETGIRLTGGRTWHHPSQTYILTPKPYGKSISPDQLPQGIARIFPFPNDVISPVLFPPSTALTSATDPSTSPSDKIHSPSTPPTPISAVVLSSSQSDSQPPSPTYTNHAISVMNMSRVLEILLGHLDELISVLERLEARFVGMSLLIVYESDPDRLVTSLDRFEALQNKLAAKAIAKESLPPTPISPKQGWFDDGDEDDDEGEFDDEDSDDESDEDDDEDDGRVADEKRAKRCPPVTMRLIDFVHSRLAPGEGPDEGVLFGLSTFRTLLEERLEKARGMIDEISKHS
ncbi:hypothetical protein M231_07495 [Tremella mesenterica]|uniref:Kinase n=1 Tax=Tremella mesenterica TaxID=5217 RepID=A0A4Q1BFK9_TREME|nr:uncharacterized protein TREMEDRAFT_34340 [Tremella mesenterica DSM 1558]EIW66995.1 hypothetical protein TREMEDRAFT_34340 [Tremella mesenterica DSM 1558]RXK35241.1 hypothetical protein M231_07495 [Tremella mesenterica]